MTTRAHSSTTRSRALKVETQLLANGRAVEDEARAFAAAGVDGVFTFEGPHDPFVPLTVAAATTDLAISTSVALAFVRSPMSFAHLAWDLQHLSSGRFTLGLGTQVRGNVERRYGMAFDRPVARMREIVEALHAIFDRWQHGTPLAYEGEFYRHTLMQPLFDPGPLEWGPPPVLVGALGPQMTRMAAAVADGVIVHPVMTPRYLAETTAPNLAAGAARGGRSLAEVSIVADVIVATGRDEAEMATATDGVRALLAFYLSTPAYAAPLVPYGWEALHTELHALSKAGRWDEMAHLVDDEVLSTLAVVGEPSAIAPAVRDRFAIVDPERVGFYLPYLAPNDLVAAVVEGF